jgi:hypothetical protein
VVHPQSLHRICFLVLMHPHICHVYSPSM